MRVRALTAVLLATSLLSLGVQHSLRLCDLRGQAVASTGGAQQGCHEHRSAAPARHADDGQAPSCCVAGGVLVALPSGKDLTSIRPAIVPHPWWAIARFAPIALDEPGSTLRAESSAIRRRVPFAGLRSHLVFRTILV